MLTVPISPKTITDFSAHIYVSSPMLRNPLHTIHHTTRKVWIYSASFLTFIHHGHEKVIVHLASRLRVGNRVNDALDCIFAKTNGWAVKHMGFVRIVCLRWTQRFIDPFNHTDTRKGLELRTPTAFTALAYTQMQRCLTNWI